MPFRKSCLVAVALLFAGCGGGSDKWRQNRPKLSPATGTVMFNGEPLGDAVVMLYPVAGTHSASAHTDSSGRFVLTTFDQNDGAVAGDYQVSVIKARVEYEPDPENPRTSPPMYHAEQSLIPENYGDQAKSDLRATIPTDGEADLKLELVGKEGKLKVLADRRGKSSS